MNHFASYMICGTPRSGSTLLCGLLEDAGCGRPDSYFRRQWMPHLTRDFGIELGDGFHSIDFSRRYLEAILAEGKGGSEVFGLRLMFENLDELSDRLDGLFPGLATAPERFEQAFGRPLYVYLSREDKVAQAVSLLKASQTGLWHVAPDGSEIERTAPHREAVYDYAAIKAQVDELERHDEGWRDWFRAHGIEPLRLTYDSLSRDPRAGLVAMLSALGMETARAASVRPQTAKLADTTSESWIARFRAGDGRQGVVAD